MGKFTHLNERQLNAAIHQSKRIAGQQLIEGNVEAAFSAAKDHAELHCELYGRRLFKLTEWSGRRSNRPPKVVNGRQGEDHS